MSETEAKTEQPTAEEIKGTKRAAEVSFLDFSKLDQSHARFTFRQNKSRFSVTNIQNSPIFNSISTKDQF